MKMRMYLMTGALVVTLTSCGDEDGLTGPQKGYNEYVEQLEEMDAASREADIIGQLGVFVAEDTDVDRMLEILADVVVDTETLIADLQTISISDGELRQIHSKLV